MNEIEQLREDVRFLLNAHSKLQSQHLELQKEFFAFRYELEAKQDNKTKNTTELEDYYYGF